ncbi:MAG: HIT domain-containing protein [Planctomycetes bacterium]|jgi:diadenosine tetraphosphate (Ap4A) HIT family hydrolase|nr:HIT domain-containing protein [Planctomycetota bacterium]
MCQDIKCVFCEVKQTLLLQETRYSRLIINYFPLGKYALLAIPKRHLPLITDLDKEEITDLIILYQNAIKIINTNNEAPPLIGWFNQGVETGQTIPHFHLHIALYEKNGNLKPIERIGNKIPINDELLVNIKKIFAP